MAKKSVIPASGNTGGLSLSEDRRLTSAEFQGLAEVPPELEWFANLTNPQTKRAYQADVRDLMTFLGIEKPEEFREVTRAHVLAWRKQLESRELAAATIRRKLSAVSSLFAYLCDKNAILGNPADGVARPMEGSNEGKTPAISDAQAKALLQAPDEKNLKGRRDKAILAVFLYHGLRCDELCGLTVEDLEERRGVPHFKVLGKGSKIRYVPIHAAAGALIHGYLEKAGHGDDGKAPLFRPVKNPRGGGVLDKQLSSGAIYAMIQKYAKVVGIEVRHFSTHSLRATAATNALENDSDIAKVQDWLGHSNISTTRLYDRRLSKPEDSPTFKVSY